jgi:NADH-quinone oxidoreductase subunit C
MQAEEIYKKLQDNFGTAAIEFKSEAPSDAFAVVKADKICDISLFLRDDEDLKFDYLKCLSGMDLGENLGVVYHLYSMKFAHHFVVKVMVPKDNPKVPTVERVWRTADWHERETFDLIGVIFEGHSNLIRILCPYDWEGHPLQKNYETPEYYHGMKVPY